MNKSLIFCVIFGVIILGLVSVIISFVVISSKTTNQAKSELKNLIMSSGEDMTASDTECLLNGIDDLDENSALSLIGAACLQNPDEQTVSRHRLCDKYIDMQKISRIFSCGAK